MNNFLFIPLSLFFHIQLTSPLFLNFLDEEILKKIFKRCKIIELKILSHNYQDIFYSLSKKFNIYSLSFIISVTGSFSWQQFGALSRQDFCNPKKCEYIIIYFCNFFQ